MSARTAAFVVVLAITASAARASAQACCAGAGAVTPARLGLHDDALVGAQLRVASVFGSWDGGGRFVATPSGASELDFEEDAYAAARVLDRGQLGVLVPLVETRRSAHGFAENGGGLGDVNLSARWDFLRARESLRVPGVGLLAGVTLPTGRSAEDATHALATDATGLGAAQLTAGVALEQTFGPWLVGLSGLVSMRLPRTVAGVRMALAPQTTVLASLAYAFPDGASGALVASYTIEGDASVGGAVVPESGRRWAVLSASFALPIDDELSVVGSIFVHPPVSSLGRNQPTTAGSTLGMRWAIR
jgi:hypothetical protein